MGSSHERSSVISSTGSFSLPARALSSSCASQSLVMTGCAAAIASSMFCSETSWAPPSTMVIPSRVPATTMSRSAFSICWNVGFMTYWPSTRATLTPAIGPLNGMSEIVTAALAALMAMMSGVLIWSVEMTVGTIWISRLKAFSNRGLMGRSIRRLTRISLSFGFPSLLRNPPGIFPAA